jgi:intein-encoded DNA endonuclease-like protein
MPIQKSVDKDFFKKWSRDMSYILGFIYADGNLTKNKRGACFLAIYSADKELLFEIRKSLKSEHKISNRKSVSGFNYCIQIGSKEIFTDLNKVGMKTNKTLRMTLPKIPKKYFSDFLRGYFDGDGNVWVGLSHKNRKTKYWVIRTVFTSCSKKFLESLRFNMSKIFNENGVISKGKGNYHRLTYSVWGSLKIYKIMYNSHQSQIFLKRKKATFERFIKIKNLRV